MFIEIQLAVILIPSRRHHQSFFQMKKKINSFDSIILWVRSRTQRIVCNLAEMWFDLFLFTLNYFFFSIINDLSNQSIQFEMLFFLRNSSRFFFFFHKRAIVDSLFLARKHIIMYYVIAEWFAEMINKMRFRAWFALLFEQNRKNLIINKFLIHFEKKQI